MSVVTKGATDVTTYVVLRDSSTGQPETGYTITNLDLQYTRNQSTPAAKVDATALAATNTAHTDNKAIEVDATSSPGLYRIDWPDAAFASGADKVILCVSGSGIDPAFEEVELKSFDQQTATQSVNVTQWLGSAAATPTVAGVPEVDVTHLLGTAWESPATAGRPDVNVKAISTDTAAADNAEAFFDGTGYAGTGNTIPTVTTVTNQVTANVAQISGDTTAADNAEAFFDGTGYAGTGNTIPNVTTVATTTSVTNQVTANVTQISGDTTAADNAEAFFDGTGYAGTGNTIPTVTNVTTVNGLAAGVVTAAVIATDAIDADAIKADAVTEIQSGLATAAAVAALPTAASNADAVWDEARAGHTTAGTFGQGSASVQGNVTGSVGSIAADGITAASIQIGAITGAKIADAAIASSHFTAGAIDTAAIGSNAINASKISPDTIGASELAADAVTEIATAIVTALLDTAEVETGISVREAFRLKLAALCGKLSGAATTTITIKGADNNIDRIVATVDADQNRTAVTLTP